MEETFSNEFKRIFLLTFTKELIKHSIKRDIIKLQKIIETEERQRERKLIPVRREVLIKIDELKIPPAKKELGLKEVISKPKPVIRPTTKQIARPTLFVPKSKLPSHLEYLKPIPTAGIEIDLWKLNPLIKDPAVRIIEANPDEKVIVAGAMGTKPTDIALNKEDIDRIINRFSEISKIPPTEGIYKVAVGNLILSAIISEVIGSKFVIKKMIYPQKKQYPIMPPPMSRKILR